MNGASNLLVNNNGAEPNNQLSHPSKTQKNKRRLRLLFAVLEPFKQFFGMVIKLIRVQFSGC